MNTERAGIYIARLIGYILMMMSLYQLGGVWWALLVSGFIAWIPTKWFK